MPRRVIWCAVLWFAVNPAGLAEKPQVESIFPAGGQRGTEFEVRVTGKLDPWPLQAVCDEERITLSPQEEKGTYTVTIPAETAPGPYLVRFFNKDGATAPRQFVVGVHAERAQSGTETQTLQPSEWPVVINGKLESRGALDRFELPLEAGQRFVAEVVSYALDASLDPLLHVRGPFGEQLAFNHDGNRLGLDPRLAFEAPVAGDYELHLSAFAHPPRADIRFTGGEDCVYRLTIAPDDPRDGMDLPAPRAVESPEAVPVELPAEWSGVMEERGDVDRYAFEAEKGAVLHFVIEAAEHGSWMDPVLVIEDAAGKELKRQDDVDSKARHEVDLDWTVPEDGKFVACVRDLNDRSGEEACYVLRITRPPPLLLGTVESGIFAVAPGGSVEIPFKVERRYGYEGDLEVGMEGLPTGVTTNPAKVNEKGAATLTLSAAADAPVANGPVAFWVGRVGQPEERVTCRVILKGATTEAGDLLINEIERGWLTVLEQKDR